MSPSKVSRQVLPSEGLFFIQCSHLVRVMDKFSHVNEVLKDTSSFGLCLVGEKIRFAYCSTFIVFDNNCSIIN